MGFWEKGLGKLMLRKALMGGTFRSVVLGLMKRFRKVLNLLGLSVETTGSFLSIAEAFRNVMGFLNIADFWAGVRGGDSSEGVSSFLSTVEAFINVMGFLNIADLFSAVRGGKEESSEGVASALEACFSNVMVFLNRLEDWDGGCGVTESLVDAASVLEACFSNVMGFLNRVEDWNGVGDREESSRVSFLSTA